MAKKASKSGSKSKDKKASKNPKRLIVTLVCLLIMGWGVWQFTLMASRYDGDAPVWIHIPKGSTEEALKDTLRSALGNDYGTKVAAYWSGNPEKSRGAYLVQPGDKAVMIARNIENGRQTPIKLTFNNIRTLEQLADRLASKMDWSANDFITAFDKIADDQGLSEQQLLGRMMPDTYEVYWTSDPEKVIDKILDNYDKFWTDERKEQAKDLGLTPDQVAIIASIAEEETAKADERGKVARLYINRLHKGMKLQADPTVKFAVGDFSIKRIGGSMLSVDSPYNTYKYAGLPPAPIRIPDRTTLEGVLSAPEHNYIYMCAKSDFSGYHDFTSDYSEHQRNAAAFRSALDARGIKL